MCSPSPRPRWLTLGSFCRSGQKWMQGQELRSLQHSVRRPLPALRLVPATNASACRFDDASFSLYPPPPPPLPPPCFPINPSIQSRLPFLHHHQQHLLILCPRGRETDTQVPPWPTLRNPNQVCVCLDLLGGVGLKYLRGVGCTSAKVVTFHFGSSAGARRRGTVDSSGPHRHLSVTVKLYMAARMSISWGLVAICIMAGAAEGFAGFCPAARVGSRLVGSNRPPLSTRRVSSGRIAVGLRMSVDGESALPGIWSIEAEMEDADLKCSLSLNGDRTVTLPPGTDLPHKFPTR
jgi:hypothetical protein